MEIVGIVQPYADEPLAHTSDKDEDDEEDQDGLTPAVLRARFEDEVTVKDWLVPAAAALKRLDVIFALRSKILLQTICLCDRCTCGECAKENLTGALEYRCCKEICRDPPKADFRWKYRAFEVHHKTRRLFSNDQQNSASSGRAIVERQKWKRLSSSRWAN